MQTYDIIIIGSGGGAKIAQALNRLGKITALIEKENAGGTCLNRGCIPSKMLIHPAGIAEKLRQLQKFKMDSELRSIDFEALVASINSYTDGMSGSIVTSFEQAEHVDYYAGEARFVSDHTVQVGDHKLSAPMILIATGSRPSIPDIPGLNGTPYMTSTETLRNRTLPPRLIVLGGGYIAAELGGAYAGFGSDVTYILRSSFLRREDTELVAEFKKSFSRGKTIHEKTQVLSVSHQNGLFTLECEAGDGSRFTVEAEALLVATGITPNSDQLGLEHTQVVRKPDGFIEVDPYLQTAAPGVFALGDVAGNYLFRHTVNFEAEYWLEAQMLSDSPAPIVYPPVPSAVFTHPELASVGITEQQARMDGRDVVIGKAAYPSCAMAMARGLEEGLVKLIFARDTGRLLGAHLVGDEASTMVQELVLALTAGMTAADIYRQIYIHPAFPEVIRNAVRDALKQLDPARAVLF
jgi:mycothione reductase